MKYTIHVHNNETGEEMTYWGDKIICVAMNEEDDGETMAAKGQIDVSTRDFASWLASNDFYDDLLQQRSCIRSAKRCSEKRSNRCRATTPVHSDAKGVMR